ncbi:ubiquinone biosynthesis protein UbiA [Thermaurantimonas aggregans]|uniref:Ubiquinone biosynthesis protein UbiA n=1 Tax=Thermaurantimonas aggregans TaxID=2173829 RepID=A0A401XN20_9FLAO|nr:geranylgeranylglycerol-phosphate geranylgeranyltransferase [Thermaurantimonas aggregans]GCD78424.1 ubiquinone biosynthesis protein UbiA [Thermaurantimonas aggregans]
MEENTSHTTGSSSPTITLKILALLSHVRWQNILVLALSQYLAVFFVLNDPKDWNKVLTDWVMHIIILCGMLAVAGGYLINNFYDREKDLINRPHRTLLEAYVNNDLIVRLYILINFLALVLSLLVSLRAFFYYVVFIVLLWFYSHKVKKKPLAGNLLASSLAIYPFFSVFIYYKLHNWNVLFYTLLIWMLLYTRELIKDLESHRGDLIAGYHTLPVLVGKLNAQIFLRWILLADVVFFLLFSVHVFGRLNVLIYYTLAVAGVIFGMFILSLKENINMYIALWHQIFRIIVFIGVFFLALEPNWHLV